MLKRLFYSIMLLIMIPVFACGEKVFSPYGSNGIRQFESNGMMGICNSNGEILLPTEYDYISPVFYDGRAMIEKDKKYGFYDDKGNIIIEPIWKWASNFQEGLAAVMTDDEQLGYIDRSGNMVVQPVWTTKSDDKYVCGRVLVYNAEGTPYLLDNEGNIVLDIYEFLKTKSIEIKDGIIVKSCDNGCFIVRLWQEQNDCYIYYIIKSDLSVVGPFNSTAFDACIHNDILLLKEEISSTESRVKYINLDGKVVIDWPNSIETIDDATDYAEGRAFIKVENHKWTCFDLFGNDLFSLEHDYIPVGYIDGITTAYDYDSEETYYYDKEGCCLFTILGGQLASNDRISYYDASECAYGYYDYDKNIVIRPIWQYAGNFENNYAIVYDKDNLGYWIDIDGCIVAPYIK